MTERMVSSRSSVGKAGQLYVNHEIRTGSHTIHKNKLKVVYRPKYKTQDRKIPRRGHRQNLL